MRYERLIRGFGVTIAVLMGTLIGLITSCWIVFVLI